MNDDITLTTGITRHSGHTLRQAFSVRIHNIECLTRHEGGHTLENANSEEAAPP